MRAAIGCIVCLCLISGCCALEKGTQRAFAKFAEPVVVRGLVSGMEITDPLYTPNFANGPFLTGDWPRWLAWRISRLVLIGVGFGLYSHEAREEVGRTAHSLRLLMHHLFGPTVSA